MKARLDLIQYLRDRILGEMHVGHVHAGDQLPGIRDIAKRLGKNPRTVAHAYRALESEGLVEVRGRSGVYVAPQEVTSGGTSQETARWLTGVILEGWKRRFVVSMLPELIQRSTQSVRLRCGLIETVEDSIIAIAHELQNDWALEVETIDPGSFIAHPNDFTGIDFFATTSFYAPAIHNAVQKLGKDLVVLTVHAGLQTAIRERLAAGNLTVVAVDAEFGARVRVVYGSENNDRENVRIVLARDDDAIARLDPDEPVLLTRAARNRIGAVRLTTIFPHSPTLSTETAAALAGILVRGNLDAAGG